MRWGRRSRRQCAAGDCCVLVLGGEKADDPPRRALPLRPPRSPRRPPPAAWRCIQVMYPVQARWALNDDGCGAGTGTVRPVFSSALRSETTAGAVAPPRASPWWLYPRGHAPAESLDIRRPGSACASRKRPRLALRGASRVRDTPCCSHFIPSLSRPSLAPFRRPADPGWPDAREGHPDLPQRRALRGKLGLRQAPRLRHLLLPRFRCVWVFFERSGGARGWAATRARAPPPHGHGAVCMQRRRVLAAAHCACCGTREHVFKRTSPFTPPSPLPPLIVQAATRASGLTTASRAAASPSTRTATCTRASGSTAASTASARSRTRTATSTLASGSTAR
jgi:hypothetical protein